MAIGQVHTAIASPEINEDNYSGQRIPDSAALLAVGKVL